MTESHEIIRQAIGGKLVISAQYKGKYRELCPHALGWKGDRRHALFYQSGGESSSGLSDDPTQNWRCMDLIELDEVEIMDGEWATADNHSRPATCFDRIDVEVAY